MANVIPFLNLPPAEQIRLQDKYGRLGGQMIQTPEGIKVCYGGTCGCIPVMPSGSRRGSICPISRSIRLQSAILEFQDGKLKSIWRLGDPVGMNFQNGTILTVEY